MFLCKVDDMFLRKGCLNGESLPFKFLRSRFLYVGFFTVFTLAFVIPDTFILQWLIIGNANSDCIGSLLHIARGQSVRTVSSNFLFSILNKFSNGKYMRVFLNSFYLVAACLVRFWCISSVGERGSLKKAHQNGLVFLFDDSAFRFNSVCNIYLFIGSFWISGDK